MKRSFTLLELVIVIVIIGVLATIGFSQYYPLRERAFDREAEANLRLILAAERIYRMEDDENQYIACADNTAINNNLRLMLPTNNPNWNYLVQTCVAGVTFCAQATRNGSDGRSWHIHSPTAEFPDPQPETDICHGILP